MFNGTAVAQTMLVPFSVNALSLVAIEPGREVGAAWEQSLIDRTGAYCDGMDNEQAFPVIRQTVLDTADPRRLAEFYGSCSACGTVRATSRPDPASRIREGGTG
jgi:hypothetical protein